MANNIRTQVVQGFKVDSFLVKPDEIKLVLKASKDDVRAGTFNMGDILSWLELHSTADCPIELSLMTEELPDE
jgi:hypothetical protein